MLGITVRGGTIVPARDYEYAHLQMHSRMLRADVVASALRTGRFIRSAPGEREFREIGATEGTAEWLTSGAVWGMTGPLPTPSYYFAVQHGGQELITKGRLSEPAYGPGQLYYQSGDDALWEVLYGVTRHQGRRDLMNQIVIHLPYVDAYIESVSYVDGQGVVVNIGEGGKGWAAGHELQALWKIHFSETSYQRAAQAITHAGGVTFYAGAEPAYFAASLQNEEGLLVDYVERFALPEAAAETTVLPIEALPEAFDFLASVWRNVTKRQLFAFHRVGPAAGMAAAVFNRSDFSSRLSELGEVLKAMDIDGSLIDPQRAQGLAADSALARLKIAIEGLLMPPDLEVATGAIDVLQDIVRIRVALQHQRAQPDLKTVPARLGIAYPPDWPQAWEVVRHSAVGALRDLRQALESALT
jgi:hypothetical protein